jgi:ABC-type transport system substrate-binding protein
VKNPDYFLKDAAGRPLPYLDGLNYTIVADQSAQIDSLVAGRLDMSAMNFGIPTQEVLERLKTQAPTMVIDSRVQYPGPVFCFNNDYGPLKDIRVRRALAMLVDQKQLVMAGYGGDNWGGYSAFFLPPPYSLTAAEGGKLLGWDKPWDTRVAEAKKLLAEAGYAAGFKLKLQVGSTPQMQREVAVLADTYRRNLGLDTEIEAVRDPTEWRKMREQKNFQMTFDAIGGSEPDDYITFLMTGGSSNFMKYSNPKVDALLLQQSTTMDLGKRVQATQEMARLLLEDMVFVPAHGGTLYVAWQPYVKGYVNQELSYGTPILLERVWLSK